jgi:hypothetical protein
MLITLKVHITLQNALRLNIKVVTSNCIKTRSAFEKYLRFNVFMSDFLLVAGKPFQGMQE